MRVGGARPAVCSWLKVSKRWNKTLIACWVPCWLPGRPASQGLPVHRLLIEATVAIERELYLSLLVDRASESGSW